MRFFTLLLGFTLLIFTTITSTLQAQTSSEYATGQFQLVTGKVYNMQGPNASAWDLINHKERFLSDNDSLKHLVNTNKMSDLPAFKKDLSPAIPKSVQFYKISEKQFTGATFTVTANFKPAYAISNTKVGECFYVVLPNKSFVYLRILEITDDGKAKVGKGNNLDYISFEYKYLLPAPPETKEAIFTRAKKMYDDKKFASAGLELDKIYQMDSTYFEARYLRGLTRMELQDFGGAAADFVYCASIKPADCELFYRAGQAYSKFGHHDEAIEYFSKAIACNPIYFDAYSSRANEQFLMSRYQLSIDDYSKCIELKPDDYRGYYGRGLSKTEFGKFQTAIPDFDKTIELFPGYSYAFFWRGFAKSNMADSRGAITDYNQAIKLDPKDKASYFNRAHDYRMLKKYDSAIVDYDRVIKMDAKFEDAYFEKAHTVYESGDKNGALTLYDEAMKKFPNDGHAYFNRGIFYYEIKKDTEALADLDRAIELIPDDAEAYHYRALVKEEMGDNPGACGDINKAIELGFGDVNNFKAAVCK
jgi:tetratricopeptide (TPR) repeat protein